MARVTGSDISNSLMLLLKHALVAHDAEVTGQMHLLRSPWLNKQRFINVNSMLNLGDTKF
jgi:hypothetical protein